MYKYHETYWQATYFHSSSARATFYHLRIRTTKPTGKLLTFTPAPQWRHFTIRMRAQQSLRLNPCFSTKAPQGRHFTIRVQVPRNLLANHSLSLQPRRGDILPSVYKYHETYWQTTYFHSSPAGAILYHPYASAVKLTVKPVLFY